MVILQNQFEIYPSTSQLILLLGSHGLAGLAIGVFIEPIGLMLGGITLLCLLAFRESRQLLGQRALTLKFNPSDSSIELREHGQPYFYRKYKVYATRWFAILKLIDKHKTRTLILNPDRFDTIQSYRQLRFQLCRAEQADVA